MTGATFGVASIVVSSIGLSLVFGDVIPPAEVSDLTVTESSANVHLEWSPVLTDITGTQEPTVQYLVYRSTFWGFSSTEGVGWGTLENTSFEDWTDGAPDYWATNGSVGTLFHEEEADHVMFGEAALRVDRADDTGYFGVFQSLVLEPGYWYRVEFWSKASSIVGGDNVRLLVRNRTRQLYLDADGATWLPQTKTLVGGKVGTSFEQRTAWIYTSPAFDVGDEITIDFAPYHEPGTSVYYDGVHVFGPYSAPTLDATVRMLADSTSIEDDVYADNDTYFYLVSAYDGADPDRLRNEGNARSSLVLSPPTLDGTGTAAGILLTWGDASPAEEVAGYALFRGRDAGEYDIRTDLLSVESFEDTDVVSGVTYYYALAAIDSGGGLSTLSNEKPLRQDGVIEIVDIHVDHLGSTRRITDDSGAVISAHDYFPFGRELSPSANDKSSKMFTGHERDAGTGLDYMFARYYGSSLGRFLSVDPVGGRKANPQTWNGYPYVLNNPIVLRDPDGEEPVTATVVTVAAVGAAAVATSAWLANRNPNGGTNADQIVKQTAEAANEVGDFVSDTAGAVGGFLSSAWQGVTSVFSKETGSYTNEHGSGKKYHGKGDKARSQQSGKEKEKANDDTHTATDWTPAENDEEAFKDEDARIQDDGGVESDSNYNKINSPGRKLNKAEGN